MAKILMTVRHMRALSGACSCLEMACDRVLLWCACRHHVYELMAKAAWNAVFPGKSVCPGEKLIQEFATWWSKADSIPRRRSASDRPNLLKGVKGFEDCLQDFKNLSAAMGANGKSSFPRDDYGEMMELFEVKSCVTNKSSCVYPIHSQNRCIILQEKNHK